MITLHSNSRAGLEINGCINIRTENGILTDPYTFEKVHIQYYIGDSKYSFNNLKLGMYNEG